MSGSKAIGWLAMWLQTDTLVWLLSRLLSLRMYLFLVLVVYLASTDAVEVHLTPSLNSVTLPLNDTAVFYCTVYNNTDYFIHWTLSHHTPAAEDLIYSHNFLNDTTLPSHTSTLVFSFTATMETNGSIVSCSAQLEPGGPLLNVISSTVWIQGYTDLVMVNSLSCNDKGLCSWSRPQCHSNTVVQYNLTVVQNNTVVLETTTTNTYWTYCPLYLEQFGEFELTVAPFCSTLGIIIGESVSTTISGSKGNKGISLSIQVQEFWKKYPSIYNLAINTDKHILNCSTNFDAWVTDASKNGNFNASKVTRSNGGTLEIEFNIPDNIKWNLYILLYVNTSLILSVKKPISTFDVQDFDAVNPELGVVCFRCMYITNSTAQGCFVILQATSNDSQLHVTIIRKSNTVASLAYDYCIDKVTNGTYSVAVHDLEHSGSISNDPAIIIETMTVNGIISSTPSYYTPILKETSLPTTSTEGISDEILFVYIVSPFIIITLFMIMLGFLLILLRVIHKKKLAKLVNNPVKLISHIQAEKSYNQNAVVTEPQLNITSNTHRPKYMLETAV